MGTLYLVSTPIGNLADLTRRAATTLESVTRILAEDTRRTRALLSHLGLHTPLISLHAHNEASRRNEVLAWLASGEDLALVSDAGTPLVSDPGSRLVEAVLREGHLVVPIPGPSAVLAALVGSGFSADRFTFLGFLPRKGPERAELLERIGTSPETVVLFESPGRVRALLSSLKDTCGPKRPVAVARELTKLHEEFVRGPVKEVLEHFRTNSPRGEFVIVLAGAREEATRGFVDEAAIRALAQALLDEGVSPSKAAKEVARRLRAPRNLAYDVVQQLTAGRPSDEADRGPSEVPPLAQGEDG